MNVDEQRILDRLREHAKKVLKQGVGLPTPEEAAKDLIESYESALAVIDSQRREIEELRLDAERWRFVREHLAPSNSPGSLIALDLTAWKKFAGSGTRTAGNLEDAIDWLIAQAKVNP